MARPPAPPAVAETVMCVTSFAQGNADTRHMNKHSTPLLNAVQAQHRADDKRLGTDPYNTARVRALRAEDILTEGQKLEAQQLLDCFETKLELLP